MYLQIGFLQFLHGLSFLHIGNMLLIPNVFDYPEVIYNDKNPALWTDFYSYFLVMPIYYDGYLQEDIPQSQT
jgi:hypothetical protein